MTRLPLFLLAVLLAAPAVRAEEGMWTFDNFPSARVQKAYGFSPDQAWLDHVRLSSVRLAVGCSGSFVSANGLVMTNHHCARRCIQDLSTPEKDFTPTGSTPGPRRRSARARGWRSTSCSGWRT